MTFQVLLELGLFFFSALSRKPVIVKRRVNDQILCLVKVRENIKGKEREHLEGRADG